MVITRGKSGKLPADGARVLSHETEKKRGHLSGLLSCILYNCKINHGEPGCPLTLLPRPLLRHNRPAA